MLALMQHLPENLPCLPMSIATALRVEAQVKPGINPSSSFRPYCQAPAAEASAVRDW